eukprot:gene62839-85947_t
MAVGAAQPHRAIADHGVEIDRGREAAKPPFLLVPAATDDPFALGVGRGAAAAGLSAPLGALVAGLMLAETEYRRQIEVTIEPFKGLLLGVFLISVGMALDLDRILADPLAVLAACLGLVALKGVIIAGLGRAFGLRLPTALHAGLLLGPGGEFGFVIIGLGLAGGLIGADAAAL